MHNEGIKTVEDIRKERDELAKKQEECLSVIETLKAENVSFIRFNTVVILAKFLILS